MRRTDSTTHLVVALTTGKSGWEFSFLGSRSSCHTYIRSLARWGRPTHFYYVIRNTERAKLRFRKNHDLPLREWER